MLESKTATSIFLIFMLIMFSIAGALFNAWVAAFVTYIIFAVMVAFARVVVVSSSPRQTYREVRTPPVFKTQEQDLKWTYGAPFTKESLRDQVQKEYDKSTMFGWDDMR